MGENVIGTLQNKVAEHDKQLDKHDERLCKHDDQISNIQVSTGKFETKLDITNKILAAIALMLLSGIGGLFFQALSR